MTLPLRVFNTLSRRLDPIEPGPEGVVRIYCCGPTVYDVPHVGHARAALVPDLLVRRLRGKGSAVRYARNITDVDDKILARSQAIGEEPLSLSERMAGVYQNQMREVGCLDPNHEPKVSAHLPQIFGLIATLIENGSAYAVAGEGGGQDVYFAVRSAPDYGKLSRRRIDELVVGARVEPGEKKRDPLDFALWKSASDGEWGWDSPWGRGRPGWHIECSAMSEHYLGHGFEVHCGGMDLIFPHHENEIAQSEAAHPGQGPFARIWMHNGFVNIDREKMSKSLNNSVTVSDALARNDPEGFRWFLLAAHYRGPIQFDTETLADGRVIFPGVDEAERRVDYVYGALERLAELSQAVPEPAPELPPQLEAARQRIEHIEALAGAALDEDLNTPVALAQLGELAQMANETADLAKKSQRNPALQAGLATLARAIGAAIGRLGADLGLLQHEPRAYFERAYARRVALRGLTRAQIEERVEARTRARKAKDFAQSDAIRAELAALGVSLCDSPEGTTWTIAQ